MSDCKHVWALEGIGADVRPGHCLACGLRWNDVEVLKLRAALDASERERQMLVEGLRKVCRVAGVFDEGVEPNGVDLLNAVEVLVKKSSKEQEIAYDQLDDTNQRWKAARAELREEREGRHRAEAALLDVRNQWIDEKARVESLRTRLEVAETNQAALGESYDRLVSAILGTTASATFCFDVAEYEKAANDLRVRAEEAERNAARNAAAQVDKEVLASVERLDASWMERAKELRVRAEAAESDLTAARALLREALDTPFVRNGAPDLAERIEAHLSEGR